MSSHLKEYVEYIVNTGRRPLATEMFDEDWEPIGPMVRAEMQGAGLIDQGLGGLMLTDKGEIFAGKRSGE